MSLELAYTIAISYEQLLNVSFLHLSTPSCAELSLTGDCREMIRNLRRPLRSADHLTLSDESLFFPMTLQSPGLLHVFSSDRHIHSCVEMAFE